MQTDSAGKKHVIAFASLALTPAEKKYSVIHLEILAVVWALQHFQDIIMGYKLAVYTDHSPITEIFKGRNLNGRLARWYLTIQSYSPEIKYAKGRRMQRLTPYLEMYLLGQSPRRHPSLISV